MFINLRLFKVCFLILGLIGCDQASELKDQVDSVNPERKPINTSILGTNAFIAENRYGSASRQFNEIQETLKLNQVRVLQQWNDAVQPTRTSPIFYGFFDEVISSLPAGMDALVVITGIPSWMNDPANWINGNPRDTWVELWLKPNIERYGRNRKIIAWQLWNEPNMLANPDNTIMEFAAQPKNYVSFMSSAAPVVRSGSGAAVLNAATTAINQNYPQTIEYNESLVTEGILNFVDIFAIHYYGRQFENVVRNGGVQDFVNGLGRPVWVTESGAQGVGEQLKYGEQVWNFLTDKMPPIERIYQYQFAESTDPTVTYGLKNASPDTPISDLYVYLRDR